VRCVVALRCVWFVVVVFVVVVVVVVVFVVVVVVVVVFVACCLSLCSWCPDVWCRVASCWWCRLSRCRCRRLLVCGSRFSVVSASTVVGVRVVLVADCVSWFVWLLVVYRVRVDVCLFVIMTAL